MGFNVVVIGRTEILYETVSALIQFGHKIVLIITAKAAPEYTRTEIDFQLLAKNLNIPYVCTARIRDERKLIASIDHIDIGVSLNYSSIIPQDIIDLFPYGILNAHGGDLPRYRGNACQAWAILNGEDRVGLCIHKMIGDELDSGDIIVKEFCEIIHETKITAIYEWMSVRIPLMFIKALEHLERDPAYVFETQSKNSKNILRCYPRNSDDGRIDWCKSNLEILRLVNACNKPYAGAFCYFDGRKMIVWDVALYLDDEIYLAMPGQIASLNQDGSVVVITGCGKLKINLIEYNDYIGLPKTVIHTIRKRLL